MFASVCINPGSFSACPSYASALFLSSLETDFTTLLRRTRISFSISSSYLLESKALSLGVAGLLGILGERVLRLLVILLVEGVGVSLERVGVGEVRPRGVVVGRVLREAGCGRQELGRVVLIDGRAAAFALDFDPRVLLQLRLNVPDHHYDLRNLRVLELFEDLLFLHVLPGRLLSQLQDLLLFQALHNL